MASITLGDQIGRALGELSGLRVVATAGGALEVSWQDGERRQRVAVREVEELVVMVASVCSEQDCSPRRVLAAAAQLKIGGVALIAGKLVLRAALRRSWLDEASLRESIVSLALSARRFARMVTSAGGDDDAVFFHYGS